MKNSTKNLLQRFLKNDATTLLLRLALLYILWFLCRIVFYLQNVGLVGPLEWNEIPGLLRGAGMFDTASILYVNALFILLSLLPFRFRETRRYQRILCWLYTVTNALALIVNSADGIYFHYARKRFTSDELSYLHNNDNTGTVVLKGLAENWYIVLWCALLIAAMVWVYRRIKAMPTRIENRWAYFGINLAVLAVAIGLVMGGIRGGFSRQTRPITLSNATLYTASNLKANLILSNPFCLIRTLGNKAIVYEKFFDQATLDSLYAPYHHPDGGAPSLGKRNIVLFVLESFSGEHSALLNPDLYPDGKGFTPFLDSLMREILLHQCLRQRSQVDRSTAVDPFVDPVVRNAFRTAATGGGPDGRTAENPARRGLRDLVLQRLGARVDGVRRLRLASRHPALLQPRRL